MSPAPGHPANRGTGSTPDAWSLTARISPRRVVRAAAVDANGQPLNAYPLVHPLAGAQPWTPWAVHLTDPQGRYRLLCADLDAKPSAEAAAADATRLSSVLSELEMPHLVCASGPTGGRHVWLGLHESLDAEVVSALAYLLKAWLPTLDVAPLVNPTSGCVRPPGTPHRLGGVSQVIAGSLRALTDATVTTDQVHALMSRIAENVQLAAPSAAPPQHRPVAEANGMPFLPGTKRPLSAGCRALLNATPTGDLSAVLWRVLCGAAAARWRFSDIAAIADAPGLEHARTLRAGATRVPRPTSGPASPVAVLRRQWTRAVRTVAELAPGQPQEGTDASFELRAEVVAAIVRAVQHRADATPGRWGRSRAGLAQRRILDALCLFHLQAVRPDEVEADIRRLALTCGLDRETARRSLLALAADGWISRTRNAAGRRGARWTIDPGGVVHTRVSRTLSQADPRPAGTGPALRTALGTELVNRLRASALDAFATTGGLGLEAGSLYGRLADSLDSVQCSQLLGWSIEKTTRVLQRLGSVGLVEWRGSCWQRVADALDRVAVDRGTEGVGRRRADLYAEERALWAWWREELDLMRAGRLRKRRQRLRSQPRQGISWPMHPRRPDGKADFVAARHAMQRRSVAPNSSMSFRGTPKISSFSRLTFDALSPKSAPNRTGPGLPWTSHPQLERTRSFKNLHPGCPPTALFLTSGR
ncbi:hypothetical protein [Propionicicella superfundia]|uniref:hypothetical protein n=1 Tax=Propionicicella superfundia TaxID=348582 RepID=UPI0012EC0B26|nr:hypothetical protein [Propionicicella superfundia]